MLNNVEPLDPAGWPKVNEGAPPDVCGNPVTPFAGDDGALEPNTNGLLLGAFAFVGAPNVKAGVFVANGLLGVEPGAADG